MLLETSWAGMVNLYLEYLSLRMNPLNSRMKGTHYGQLAAKVSVTVQV